MKAKLLLGCLFVFGILLNSVSAYWWNDTWQHRALISVTESSGFVRSGETITLNMASISGFSRADVKTGCEDIRVIDYTLQTEKPFTNLTCNSTSVVISFSCSAVVNASGYPCAEMYWENPSAIAPTNSLKPLSVTAGGAEDRNSWWNVNWTRRTPIYVSESAQLSRTNETVNFDMASIPGFLRSDVQSECQDIRVINYANNTFTEKAFTNTTCTNTSVVLSFACSAPASTSGYTCADVYWKNPSATAPTTPSSLRLTKVGGDVGVAGTYVEYGYMENKVTETHNAGVNHGNPRNPMFGNRTGMSFYQGHMDLSYGGLSFSDAESGETKSNQSFAGLYSTQFNIDYPGAYRTVNVTHYDTGKALVNASHAGTTTSDYRAAMFVPRASSSGGIVDHYFAKTSGTFTYNTIPTSMGDAAGLNYYGAYNATTKEYLAFVLAGNNTQVQFKAECYSGYDRCYLYAHSNSAISNPSWQFLVLHGKASDSSDLQSKLDNEYTKSAYPLSKTVGTSEG